MYDEKPWCVMLWLVGIKTSALYDAHSSLAMGTFVAAFNNDKKYFFGIIIVVA